MRKAQPLFFSFLFFSFLFLPEIAFGAINFDVAGYARTAATSAVSLTATSPDEIAIICAWPGSSGTVSSPPTVGGSPSTFITSTTSNSQIVYMYYFLDPPTSSTSYSVTGSIETEISVSLYTGQDVTDYIDNFGSVTGTSPFLIGVTPVNDESWLIACVRNTDTGVNSPGSRTTIRNAGVGLGMGDTDGSVASVGFDTMQWLGNSAGDAMFGTVISLSPVISADSGDPATTTSEIGYQDWLFVNSVIIGLLGFLGIGVIMNPLK